MDPIEVLFSGLAYSFSLDCQIEMRLVPLRNVRLHVNQSSRDWVKNVESRVRAEWARDYFWTPRAYEAKTTEQDERKKYIF